MGSENNDRRDVTIHHTDGRTETISNVSNDTARELERLDQKGVAWTESTPAKQR